MNSNINVSLKGRYLAIVRDSSLREVRRSEWSDNVVTNLGVQMLLGGAGSGGSSVFNVQCSCGSGNSTPSVTDTQIQSFVAGSTNSLAISTTKNSTVHPYYVMHTITWRFNQGQATGNIAELCVVSGTSTPTASSPVFSRALVRDAAGNPTVISVQPDEFLEVKYELYLYVPQEVTGTFSQIIDGVSTSFDYTMMTSGMLNGGNPGSNSGWPSITAPEIPRIFGYSNGGAVYSTGASLGPVTSDPTGTSFGVTGSTSATGNYSGKYRDITFNCGLDSANTTFSVYRLPFTLGAVKMQISPPITKMNTKTYSITFRVTLDNTI